MASARRGHRSKPKPRFCAARRGCAWRTCPSASPRRNYAPDAFRTELQGSARRARGALPRRRVRRDRWCTRAPSSSTRCCARCGARNFPPATKPGRSRPSAAMAAASCTRIPTSTSCSSCPRAPDDAGRGVVERFVAFLWDIGLEVGHSVRTVEQCARGKRGRRRRDDHAGRSAAAGRQRRSCSPRCARRCRPIASGR